MIANDVKFNNTPLDEEKPKKFKRNRSEAELKKQLAEEEYNYKAHEQRYKRLMHLLNKSQFYSSYLVKKIENKNKKEKVTHRGRKRKHPPINNENVSPKKKKNRVDIEKYNIQEYISMEVNNKIWTFFIMWIILFNYRDNLKLIKFFTDKGKDTD